MARKFEVDIPDDFKGRFLMLTHQEIEDIRIALQFVYDHKLDIIKQNRKILGDERCKEIVNGANRYYDLMEEITNVQKDV